MGYITISDVRNAGLLEADYSDPTVQAAIDTWQSFLDRACRQWFEPKELTLTVDGTDSDAIHTGVPIIDIEYLRINDSATALDAALYKVYSSRSWPDDRRNPRIKLIDSRMNSVPNNIYIDPMGYGQLKFRKGRQNQVIKGTFGFVELDDSPPPMIKHALLKLVIEKLVTPLYIPADGTLPAGAIPPLIGTLLEEETDGHRVKYAPAGGELATRAPGLSGITSDQEILNIITLYKAPIGIATPANMTMG